jgi:bifunctional DNA-binding transcriptional regulator/antitoxin component of YhaV-PrlF toxin-antitoxin module
MQAIEIETDITKEGHIHLPGPLRKVFGRHARLILLLDESQPAEKSAAIDNLLSLRGALRDDADFDAAMREIDQAWQAWNP